MTDEISKAAESANKNLDNALEVAVGALHKIYCTRPDGDILNSMTAKEALNKISRILKVKQKD